MLVLLQPEHLECAFAQLGPLLGALLGLADPVGAAAHEDVVSAGAVDESYFFNTVDLALQR